MMGMTSEEKDIMKLTGLGIGNVYLRDIKNEYKAQKDGNRILDCSSCNFHLFPVLKSKEDDGKWQKYIEDEKKIREKIRKSLKDKIPGLDIGKSNGQLKGIPKSYSDKGLNSLFWYLQVKKDNRYFILLLKRFFIDKNNKVNCIFGEVQFYSSLNGKVNEHCKEEGKIDVTVYAANEKKENIKSIPKIKVHYPKSYIGQNEKMIRLSETDNKVNVYNPKGLPQLPSASALNSDDIKNYTNQIADAFNQYIQEIEAIPNNIEAQNILE